MYTNSSLVLVLVPSDPPFVYDQGTKRVWHARTYDAYIVQRWLNLKRSAGVRPSAQGLSSGKPSYLTGQSPSSLQTSPNVRPRKNLVPRYSKYYYVFSRVNA